MKLHWLLTTICLFAISWAGCDTADPPQIGSEHSIPSGVHGIAESTSVEEPVNEPGLVDLSDDADELRQAFNAASGKVRLVLLVSPG